MIIAIVAGLLGMIGWGLADFFAKMTIDKVGDMATLTWAHFFGVGLLVCLILWKLTTGQVLTWPHNLSELGLLLLFGILQALVYFFVYRGFGKGQLAILNPIFSSYSGIVVILSVLVFGEAIGINRLAILALIFLGIITISLDRESLAIRQLKFTKLPGVPDILTASALAALWTVLWGHFVIGKDWLTYAAIMYVFMSITILSISKLQKINLKITDPKIWKYFFLIGLAEVSAYVGVSIGYSLTSHTSVVAVLSSAFSIPTVILASLFLKERITKLQLSGVVAVVLGVVLIALV